MIKLLRLSFACALLIVSCKDNNNKDQAFKSVEVEVEELQKPNIIYIMADDLG